MLLMEDFKKYYCLDGTFIGKDTQSVKLLYPVYCNLFGVEAVHDIVNEICKHYNLVVKGNKFVDFKQTLAKIGY